MSLFKYITLKSFIIIVTTLIWVQFAIAQDCNCKRDFDFVASYIESNFPGFDKNMTLENEQVYLSLKEKISKQTERANTQNECLKYLTYYVEFFEDNHTKMRTLEGPKVDESSPESVNTFFSSQDFLQTEILPLTEEQKSKKYSVDDIRGLYVSSDSTYTIALIENPTDFRDYAGVIISSGTKLWKKNQIKFEIKHKIENVYEGFFYNRYHQGSYKTVVPFNNGFLGNDWIKVDKENTENYSLNLNEEFNYSVIDSTVILRIPSFMGIYTRKIDSLYTAAKEVIEMNPYLLIDVRDNGGGNSSNFSKIIPYLYTKPIIDTEFTELYATKDIIKLYEDEFKEIMKDSTQVNEETLQAFREYISELKKAAPNSFIKESETDTLTLTPKSKPKKVGILYNRGCASACEDLLFKAQHSDKTILLGDNSGGFVGYGNIFTVYTPCYNFGLSCSTTRYSTQWKYEVIGITPDVKLDYGSDWIQQSIEILKK